MKIMSIAAFALVAVSLLAGCGPKTPEAGLTQDEQGAPAVAHDPQEHHQVEPESHTVEHPPAAEPEEHHGEHEGESAQSEEQHADEGPEGDGHGTHEHADAEQEVAALPAGANRMCPVMPDEPVDPALFVEYEGKRIYVCCEKCLKRVAEDPAAWYAKAYGS